MSALHIYATCKPKHHGYTGWLSQTAALVLSQDGITTTGHEACWGFDVRLGLCGAFIRSLLRFACGDQPTRELLRSLLHQSRLGPAWLCFALSKSRRMKWIWNMDTAAQCSGKPSAM